MKLSLVNKQEKDSENQVWCFQLLVVYKIITNINTDMGENTEDKHTISINSI